MDMRTTPIARVGLLALCVSAVVPSVKAEPLLVDRLVAVVGDQPILMSDIESRRRGLEASASEAIRGDARREVFRQILKLLIEEQLVRSEAKNRQVEVTTVEIDAAVETIAKSNGLSVERIYEEAARSGFDREPYRQQVATTLLEHKLLQLDLWNTTRVRVTEADLRDAYDRLVAAARGRQPYRPSWIVLRIPDGPPSRVDETRARAAELARRARSGTPFATLAQQHSDDVATKSRGGDLGQRYTRTSGAGMALREDLERHALMLGVGEVSEPIRVENSFVVLTITDRPAAPVPGFEESRASLHERVYGEKVAEARAAWIDGLKAKILVDLRIALPGPEARR